MTSRRPYWCPKTMKRRPCWCPKPILWELNSFLMQTRFFVPINLHRCWPREWKHSIVRWNTLANDPQLSCNLQISQFKSIMYKYYVDAFPSSLLPRAWSRALIPFPFPFERLSRRLALERNYDPENPGKPSVHHVMFHVTERSPSNAMYLI